MSKSLEALEIISNIELYHKEIIEDEDMDGEWIYDEFCEYDGLILEVYKNEIQTIKQDLEAYEQLKQDHDKTLINNGELVLKVYHLEKENQELKKKLELTETARQLLYNELKCCNGISEYAQKLEKAIEKGIEMLIERRSDAYYAEEDEVYRVLDIIIEELKEVIKNEN